MLQNHPPIPTGDVLIIVPPFTTTRWASLGAHILQSCAREAGFKVSVLYANLAFAVDIGPKNYWRLNDSFFVALPGERLFAPVAFGTPRVPLQNEELDTLFVELGPKAEKWADEIAAVIAAQEFKIVGATTMFDQTSASIAVLNRLKRLRPDIVTIIGGANCEAEMAEGIAALAPEIDHIFSGESEDTFVQFLQAFSEGRRPDQRIIYGRPSQKLDAIPTPDFSHYYQQMQHYLPDVAAKAKTMAMIYETSRGCWWGEKHHCTFCGLNGMGMGFRQKEPQKVIGDLNKLIAAHPDHASPFIFMTDNIMPYTFFKTIIPKLQELNKEVSGLEIFYEQKANLSLQQVIDLAKAGIKAIQPGIESLSTALLKRMDKGVTAAQNVTLLRYARATGISVLWNLLWKFPGDEIHAYTDMLALIPLLRHLQPPEGIFPLNIDRFSPYFQDPDRYGITDIKPSLDLDRILPSHVDINKVAYHFTGSYECDSSKYPEVIAALKEEVNEWQDAWKKKHLAYNKWLIRKPPVLHLSRQTNGSYTLQDTRGLPGTEETYTLTPEQALVALAPRRYEPTPEIEWALERKIGAVIDAHYYVPLATASPDLIGRFEAQARPVKVERVPLPVFAA